GGGAGGAGAISRGWDQRRTGMWRQVTPFLPQPAVVWWAGRMSRSSTARLNWWFPLFSPGAVRSQPRARSRLATDERLWTERLQHRRPFSLCGAGVALRVGGECLEPMAVVEQEEPLAADQPGVRPSGHGHPAGDAHGVIAAKLRHLDIGPFGAAILQFEIRAARHRLAVGVEGDRIVAVDGKPGVPVDHDPFRDTTGGYPKRPTGNKAEGERENRDRSAPFLPLLPCCGHSFGERSADSQRPKKRYKPRRRAKT